MDFSFKIKTGIKPNSGKILVAEPLLADPHFHRGVIYLCSHNEEGSLGFVLNKPISKTLDYFVENLDRTDIPLYMGGPVELSSIHFIHTQQGLIGGDDAGMGIYLGGDFEEAIRLLQEKRINSNDIKFFLGYSGWSTEQLKEEIEKNSWLVTKTSQPIIFDVNTDSLWRDIILSLDKEFHQLVNLPSDPSLN